MEYSTKKLIRKQLYRLLQNILCAIIALLLCGLITLLTSCRSTKNTTTLHTERTDTLSVTVRHSTTYVPDTVFIEIPSQTSERTTRDSLSRLENDYSISSARVLPDGSLYHTLETKQQSKPVPIRKAVEHNDSIVYRDRVVTDTDIQIVEVAQERTWWEQTRICGFYVLVVLLVISYRKCIGRLFIKLIMKL